MFFPLRGLQYCQMGVTYDLLEERTYIRDWPSCLGQDIRFACRLAVVDSMHVFPLQLDIFLSYVRGVAQVGGPGEEGQLALCG